MPHKITEECINCGACIDECPEEAIRGEIPDEISEGMSEMVDFTSGESEGTFIIDPEKCTDCGSCVEVCPVDAIVEA